MANIYINPAIVGIWRVDYIRGLTLASARIPRPVSSSLLLHSLTGYCD